MFSASLFNRILIAVVLCGAVPHSTWAQSFTQEYGGMLSQDGMGIALLGERFAIATTVLDSATSQHRPKILLVGTDGQFASWNELPIPGAVFLQAAEASADGGVFLAGSVIVPGASTHDALLVKLDASGTLLWVAQPERMGNEQYFDLAALPDGG
ncbi:MAG TPA: hypothetical protein VKG92_05760, partial [Flavobacteriales bacterium]|nr:hypothetical protein [Flavobacteriales bacterium]